MKRRKSKTALPRLTVLAMSRKELQQFVEAVAQLRGIADDLLTMHADFKAARPRRRTASGSSHANGGSDEG